MNKIKSSKESSATQDGIDNTVKLTTNKSASAISHALDAVDAVNLAALFIGELETFLCTIAALAKNDEPTETGARAQVCAIRDIARLAVDFASDRSEHYSFVQDDMKKALAALKAAA